MAATYAAASSSITSLVESVAQEHHARLNGHGIAVVLRDPGAKRRGRQVLATTSKPTPALRPLLADKAVEFVIIIGADYWQELSQDQRAAVVDHELSHCGIDGETGEPYVRPHDYEEFAEIIERRGFWRRDKAEAGIQQALAIDCAVGPVRVSTLAKAAQPGDADEQP